MAKNPRFYCPHHLAPGARFPLPDEILRHGILVLRLKIGDKITLFDGQGGEYRAEITQLGRNHAEVKVGAWHDIERESATKITLLQTIQTADKMDYSVQKAVELGVHEIVPILGQRSVSRLSGERAAKRLQHWRGIVTAACEQSGRNYLPEVREIITLADYLSQLKEDSIRLYCHPQSNLSFNQIELNANHYYLALGAEGGFAENEIYLLDSCNFQALSLGPRILRSETATVSALSILQARIGDLA